MPMRSLIVIFMLFCVGFINAQKSIVPADLVADARLKNTPASFSLMKLAEAQNRSSLPSEIKDYSLLALDIDMLRRIGSTDQSFVSITIPQSSRTSIVLDLVEVNPLTDDFLVRSAPSMDIVKVKTGRHFRGIIRGQDKSVAAISIFDNEVMGLVSHPAATGNMVLGKLDDQDTYIFYQDDQIVNKISKACATSDSGIPYSRDELSPAEDGTRALTDCVKLYLEVDNDIYINKGSSNANVTAYITGLFNQVSTLYAAGQINTVVSEILIWSTTSPYAGITSSVGMLNAFTAQRQGFNGNLAQLLSYRASGGIAYVDGLCRTNPDFSMSYAGITSSYQNVPTYSWAVEVCTHEFGHLFGSQHTHACVWNGNGTAIDGCYAVEGSCPTPSPALPSGGGTIMSYCHLTNVGINFANGFGTQPGNVMRSKVTNSNCTLPCSGTGGGGGGGTPSCTQNALVLTVRTDNYPTETSWNIKNAAGTILYSGSGYTIANNVYTIPLCLPTACFTFTINDGYGDGICCSYGQGYYNIKQGATTLISGGAFGTSETKSFCATGSGGTSSCTDGIQNGQETGIDCGGPTCPVCPSCTDGIKNGLETGVDCGGPTCPACPTCTDGIKNGLETGIDCGGPICPPCGTGGGSGGVQVTNLAGHFFETGWDGWLDGGIDCYRYPGTLSPEGTFSIRLRDNELEFSAMTSPSYVMNTFDSVTVEFKFRADNFEPGEDFWLRYFNGSAWTTIKTYVAGVDFNNNVVYTRKVKINAPLSANGQFRFQSDADDNTDNVYIDAVSIKGYKTSGAPQPSCTDGIKNGLETGVDCGGPTCPACPTCTDGIKNGLETGVDCGGPTCPPCPTCTDGIQNGNETGVDCGGSTCPPCPTCTDGIQNGNETGVDCGGSCSPCGTGGGGSTTTLSGHYFEIDWDGWADGGVDAFRYAGTFSSEGSYSIRLRDNSLEASAMTSPNYNLAPYNSVSITFKFKAEGMEAGEDFLVEYFNGTTWSTLGTFVSGTDFNNLSLYTVTVSKTAPLHNNAKFRFKCDASENDDMVYIDAVVVTATNANIPQGRIITLLDSETHIDVNHLEGERGIDVYPNPTYDIIHIRSTNAIHKVRLLSVTGAEMLSTELEGNEHSINLDGYQSGIYLVVIHDENGVTTKRVVKR
jgi:hypothetical protein